MINDISVVGNVTNWKSFFDRYMKDDIRLAAVEGKKSLYVDFSMLQKYNIHIAKELLNIPDVCLANAEEALTLIDLPFKKEFKCAVRPYNFLSHKRIRDVRDDDDDKIISIEATVQNISTINKREIEAVFECARCKNKHILPQSGSPMEYIEPSYCSCNDEKKGVFRHIKKESTFEDYQKLRLQESPEDLRGDEQPRVLDLNVSDDITDFVRPGERVTVNGIMRSEQRIKGNKKTAFFDYYMDVLSIEREEVAYEDLEITPEDIVKIVEYANNEDPVSLVADSIAPWIYGLEDVKKGITALLFGGVKKPLPDGAKIRGDSHILWVGDPGVAKSQILGDVARIAPRGMYSSGLGVSGVGLTAATVKDDFLGDGQFSLRAGVLALMNGGGIACIDEFGRMDDKDREKIHPAMEQQIIPIDRAGFHTTLKSECSVLAAGNPKEGRWDDYISPAEQLGLDNALITRFDIIYITKDVTEPEKDRRICEHILETNRIGEMLANGQEIGESKVINRKVDIDILRKWIAHARRSINPVLTKDATDTLQEYFLKIRGQNGDKNVIHATMRQLEGPIRLSEAFARVRLSKTVEKKDALLAISVLADSRKGLKDPNTGEEDFDLFNTGISKAQADRRKLLVDIIGSISKEYGGKASTDLIIARAAENKLKQITVEKEIRNMKESGDIWEPEPGYIMVSRR